MKTTVKREMHENLRAWFSQAGRDLPWRQTRDPWSVLVSETMLQQTQVARVIPKYVEFVSRFPRPETLASVPTSEVLALWSGLGYNRRAIALQRCADEVTRHYEGKFPQDLSLLLALPGIGNYTARAVLVFAFELPYAVLDTNVGRILTRAIVGKPVNTHAALQVIADDVVNKTDPWIWNQALIELGAIVCQKRIARCAKCPLRSTCVWRGEGEDPAATTATGGKPQGRFEGSDRQVRGRIIRELLQGPIAQSHVRDKQFSQSIDQVALVLDRLESEAVITRNGGVIAINDARR